MKFISTFAAAAALTLGAAGVAAADTYTVTITNTLEDELLAPVLVTDAANDDAIFTMNFVTEAAEHQILTGDPAQLVESIGEMYTTVAHGMDGPPGVLLAPGKSITFDVETSARALRIISMVAPTKVPDNYVTTVVDIAGHDGMMALAGDLSRFDIGHDEGVEQDLFLSVGGASYEIVKM